MDTNALNSMNELAEVKDLMFFGLISLLLDKGILTEFETACGKS